MSTRGHHGVILAQSAPAADFDLQNDVLSATLKLWFDPSDSAARTLGSGSDVASITDKISGLVFSQGTVGARPVLNAAGGFFDQDCLDFGIGNGVVRYLSHAVGVTITLPQHVFMVLKWPTPANQYKSLILSNAPATNAIQAAAGAPYIGVADANLGGTGASHRYVANGGAVYTATEIVAEQKFLLEVETPGPRADVKHYRDGVLRAIGHSSGSTSMGASHTYRTLGSSDTLYSAAGGVGTVAVYEGTLDSTDLAAIRSHLVAKWGTPALP